MSYRLVAPAQYTEDHQRFVERFRQSVMKISSRSRAIIGGKDIDSRHLIATDAYALLVALPRGVDATGRFDRDMPCEGTACFADCFVREDADLLSHRDGKRTKAVLNIHEYADGLDALVFGKFVMKHEPSRAILGTIYSASRIEMGTFSRILPNYRSEFGTGCSLEKVEGDVDLFGTTFSELEYEVCFLLALNWSCEQIAGWLLRYHPVSRKGAEHTLHSIGDKLAAHGAGTLTLREQLVAAQVHRRMPKTMFDRIAGIKPL